MEFFLVSEILVQLRALFFLFLLLLLRQFVPLLPPVLDLLEMLLNLFVCYLVLRHTYFVENLHHTRVWQPRSY